MHFVCKKLPLKCPKATHFKVIRYQYDFISLSHQIHEINPSLHVSPPIVQYPNRPLGDAERCAAWKWSCWVLNKENKVTISLSDIWLWVQSIAHVLSEGWSLASNRDCRHLLSSNQRQITTKTRSDLNSLCSCIPKERQVPGHHAPSYQYINFLQDVKSAKQIWA